MAVSSFPFYLKWKINNICERKPPSYIHPLALSVCLDICISHQSGHISNIYARIYSGIIFRLSKLMDLFYYLFSFVITDGLCSNNPPFPKKIQYPLKTGIWIAILQLHFLYVWTKSINTYKHVKIANYYKRSQKNSHNCLTDKKSNAPMPFFQSISEKCCVAWLIFFLSLKR